MNARLVKFAVKLSEMASRRGGRSIDENLMPVFVDNEYLADRKQMPAGALAVRSRQAPVTVACGSVRGRPSCLQSDACSANPFTTQRATAAVTTHDPSHRGCFGLHHGHIMRPTKKVRSDCSCRSAIPACPNRAVSPYAGGFVSTPTGACGSNREERARTRCRSRVAWTQATCTAAPPPFGQKLLVDRRLGEQRVRASGRQFRFGRRLRTRRISTDNRASLRELPVHRTGNRYWRFFLGSGMHDKRSLALLHHGSVAGRTEAYRAQQTGPHGGLEHLVLEEARQVRPARQ